MMSLFSRIFCADNLPIIFVSLAVLWSGICLVINKNQHRQNLIIMSFKIAPMVFLFVLAGALVCGEDQVFRRLKQALIFWGVISIFIGLLLSICYDTAKIYHGQFSHLFWIYPPLLMLLLFMVMFWYIKASLTGVIILLLFTGLVFALAFIARKRKTS